MKEILTISLMLFLCAFSYAQIDVDHTGSATTFYPVEETSSVGQSFTAGATGALSMVMLDLSAQICPFNPDLDTIAFEVHIYQGNGTKGILLTTQPMVMNLPLNRGLFQINFEDPAMLTENVQYTIHLTVLPDQICDASFNIPINFVWYHAEGDTYQDGEAHTELFSEPTDDLYFQTVIDPLGIEEWKATSSPMFYPNPVIETLYWSDDLKADVLEILSLDGKLISSYQLNGKASLDLSALPSGLYLAKVSSGSNHHFQKLYVK